MVLVANSANTKSVAVETMRRKMDILINPLSFSILLTAGRSAVIYRATIKPIFCLGRGYLSASVKGLLVIEEH
jgi:hypothetical protein